jgi:hypothetical protein
MKRMVSFAIVLVVLAGCDTPAEEPAPAPVLRGITASYGPGASGLGGTLTLGEPVIEGPLTTFVVESVFQDRQSELEFCYEHAVSEDRDAIRDAHLLVTFTITPTGAVARPVSFAEDTMGAPAFSDCVAGTVGAWTFAPPASEVHVRYPLDVVAPDMPPG